MSADIAMVFSAAKARFGWTDDRTAFGKDEYWANYDELLNLAAGKVIKGDCDDFATLCLTPLREAGHIAHYVLCLTESGEAHLVCECEGMICDNRQAYVTPLERLDYMWLGSSGPRPGMPWRRITGIT